MKLEFAGSTDIGQVRSHNEDSYITVPEQGLAVVCDGMGGHAAGEVASALAIETIADVVAERPPTFLDKDQFPSEEEITPDGQLLLCAIAAANQRIHCYARTHPTSAGMGTTVVSCLFRDGVVSVCHAGDSRVYVVRDKTIKQVTFDHSWVNELMEKHQLTEEESQQYVNKNVITRALGTKREIKIDISEVVCREGDIFLLCSDGLTGMVSDSEILSTVTAAGSNTGQLVTDLITLANQAGGNDNITLCAVRVVEQEKIEDFRELKRVTVEWTDDPEIKALDNLISDKYSDDLSSGDVRQTDIESDTDLPRKKGKWILLLTIISVLIMVLLVLYFDII